MFLPNDLPTEGSRGSLIATIDGFIEPDTELSLKSLNKLFDNYTDFEVRLGTDDWCIGEHQPIKHIYIDRVKKQLVLVCNAEL